MLKIYGLKNAKINKLFIWVLINNCAEKLCFRWSKKPDRA